MPNLLILIPLVFFISCSSDPEIEKVVEDATVITVQEELKVEIDSVQQDVLKINEGKEEITGFSSVLHPEKTDWYAGEVYTDTLEMVEFNSDYDYSFCVFKDDSGKEVIVYAKDILEDVLAGRFYKVEWKVGEFAEAGEDDAVYYKEQLIQLDVLD